MDLSDSQKDDTLYLRQLFHRKQGQLARKRKALLHAMASNSVEHMNHVSEKLSELTRCSEELRKNGAEEYRTDVEFCCAYHAGVRLGTLRIY